MRLTNDEANDRVRSVAERGLDTVDATEAVGRAWQSLPRRMTITVMETEDRTCPCHSPALPSLTSPEC
jgi:hypothetical protein